MIGKGGWCTGKFHCYTPDWHPYPFIRESGTSEYPCGGNIQKGVADVHTNSGGSWSYHEIDRKEFPINGTSANVQLTLAQEQTYSFIFWTYDGNQNIYNIDDLTAIEMNALPNPITFTQAEAADAFFATMGDITITGDCSYPVELVRPLVQINVGTIGTPMQASFTAKMFPTHSTHLPIP